MSLPESSFFKRLLNDPVYRPLNERIALDDKAWDAADAYLLDCIAAQYPNAGRIVVLNDRYGAITCALPGRVAFCSTDSKL